MNNKANELIPAAILITVFLALAFVGYYYLVFIKTDIGDYRAASGGVLILTGSYLLFIAIYSRITRTGLMALNRLVLFLTFMAFVMGIYTGYAMYLDNRWYSATEAWLICLFTVYGIQQSINYKNDHIGYFSKIEVTRLFDKLSPVILISALLPVVLTIGYLVFMLSLIRDDGFFRYPDHLILPYLIVYLSLIFTGYLFVLTSRRKQYDMFVSFIMVLCIIGISSAQILLVSNSINKTWLLGSIQTIIMLIIANRYFMLKGSLLKITPKQTEAGASA